MNRLHSAAALLFLLTPLAVTAAPDARADSVESWLNRMEHAVASISYRGTMVSVRDGHVETLKVFHRVDDYGVRERIVALSGPQREILRDRDQVQCLVSGDDPLVVANPFPSRLVPRIPFDELSRSDGVYRVREVGHERVAGRNSRVIEILPRDGYRYGRRLWLDERTAMLLRSALLDDNGMILETLTFVDIELGAMILDRELEPDLHDPARVMRFRDVDEGRDASLAASQTPSWIPESLPRGFRLASVGRDADSAGNGYEHVVFSDGLASFSVYVEPFSGQPVVEQISSMGSVHVFTGQMDGWMVTVVGEVPAITVQMIGRHLRRSAQPALRHFP